MSPNPQFPEHDPPHAELPAPTKPRLWDALTELRQAARMGDIDAARQAAADMRPEQRSAPDSFSLHRAASNPRSFEVLLFLVDELGWSADARVALSSSHPAGPVALAALRSGCWRSAQALLDRSANPLAGDELGSGPLIAAAEGAAFAFPGSKEVIERLVSLGDNPAQPLRSGKLSGGNALHLCATSQFPEAIELFAGYGLDLNAPAGEALLTPLCQAAQALRARSMETLLRLGADPLRRSAHGATLLHHLCQALPVAARPEDPDEWAGVFNALLTAGLSLDDRGGPESPLPAPRALLAGLHANVDEAVGEAFAEAFLLAVSLPDSHASGSASRLRL